MQNFVSFLRKASGVQCPLKLTISKLCGHKVKQFVSDPGTCTEHQEDPLKAVKKENMWKKKRRGKEDNQSGGQSSTQQLEVQIKGSDQFGKSCYQLVERKKKNSLIFFVKCFLLT